MYCTVYSYIRVCYIQYSGILNFKFSQVGLWLVNFCLQPSFASIILYYIILYYLSYFPLCLSGSEFWIWIRVYKVSKYGSNLDPNPQHWASVACKKKKMFDLGGGWRWWTGLLGPVRRRQCTSARPSGHRTGTLVRNIYIYKMCIFPHCGKCSKKCHEIFYHH